MPWLGEGERPGPRATAIQGLYWLGIAAFVGLVSAHMDLHCGVNVFTFTDGQTHTGSEGRRASTTGSLNRRPERVTDPLFHTSDFFDARDLVQVKYKMVRHVRVEGHPVSHGAAAFGFSRPSFYQAQALLGSGGLAALVPRKPGPRRSHKLDPGVMAFLEQVRAEDASLRPADTGGSSPAPVPSHGACAASMTSAGCGQLFLPAKG